MGRRFRKKAGLGIVCLPGIGGLGNEEVVEGAKYERFYPAILEEVEEDGVGVESGGGSTLIEEGNAFLSERPDMSWRKDRLVAYAEGRGFGVEGMTKRQILSAIAVSEKEG